MNLDCFGTLIAVADDCPVREGVVPTGRGGKPTVAVLQYELIAGAPHVHTQPDVLFDVWVRRQALARAPSRAELAALRAEFFGRPQACMRASPLPKQYGWGLLFDREGRVALCPMESKTYRDLVAGKGGDVKVLKAMRSKRA